MKAKRYLLYFYIASVNFQFKSGIYIWLFYNVNVIHRKNACALQYTSKSKWEFSYNMEPTYVLKTFSNIVSIIL